MQKNIIVCLFSSLMIICNTAASAEVQIPRSMADKGRYYLLDAKIKDGITTTVHKRVGVNETGYSKTEINCKTTQYRDMGYSENGPDKITGTPSKWTDILSGSSKSDLVNFVCAQKR
ncbi:hypothetical protein [Massilia sp.]|uniref:hypothetical protein n=1 Tax=Massilia sp. TaxID=1882437 RepID=UPI00391D1261